MTVKLGHVAEQPCDSFEATACLCEHSRVGMRDQNTCRECGRPIIPDADTECTNCAWPEDRHGKGR